MTLNKSNRRIELLAKKWQEGTITDEEKLEFNNWYNSFDDNNLEYHADETPDMLKERILRNIHIRENIPFKHKLQLVPYMRIAAAALVLIFLSIGTYLLLTRQLADKKIASNIQKDRLPGTNKAVLTLANGLKISLDDATKGEVAKQSGITITKAANGQIIYTVADKALASSQQPTYNTIETPRGGQIKVNLPDGTKVWLNAASVIKFPTSFSGNERNVTLDGEAYFEVAHNAKKPFNVFTSRAQVHVLGTHFNVNAYHDEDTLKTTLLQGSVKLTYSNSSILLKPNQQGKIYDGGTGRVSVVDTSLVMAWKNEMFEFDNTDLHSLMRQVSRWYNIEVAYESGVPNDLFFGSISRNSNLSKVLKILELGGVHFKIDNKKLIVTK